MFGKSKAGNEEVQKPLILSKQNEDDLGPFPSEVDSNPTESRAQERALRAVAIVAIVSGMMNIALTMLIIMLFPLQKVFPYLVTFKSQESQVVSIEPMEINAPGMLYATEDAVRDFVTQRHTFIPNAELMKARWGQGSRLSTRMAAPLFQKFSAAAENEIQTMMAAGFNRTVDIVSVQRISQNTWQVNFKTNDTLPTEGGTLIPQGFSIKPQEGQASTAQGAFGAQGPVATTIPSPAINEKSWVATVIVDYQPQNVTYDNRLLNPLGFTVIDYSVAAS